MKKMMIKMNKMLVSLLILSFSLAANAKCLYSLKHEALLFQGYTLNFGEYLNKMVTPKGYERTFEETNLEIVPHFDLKQEGHFEYALAGFELKNSNQVQVRNSLSKRCYTQTCAVSDAKKVLVSAIDDFAKKLVRCSSL